MKRFIAWMLAFALLAVGGCASASDRNITDSLSRYSFISDTKATAEKTSGTTSRDLTIEEGDYVTVSPVHWVNTNLLSFREDSITSSDTNVVTASFYRASSGNIGVKMHAVGPGKATVIAQYTTFRTSLGLNYEDHRGNATFTQYFYVTVPDNGTVDVSLNILSGRHTSVKGAVLRMRMMKDTLDRTIQQENRDYIKEAISDYSNVSEELIDWLSDPTRQLSDMPVDTKLLSTMADVVIDTYYGAAIGEALDLSQDVYKTAKALGTTMDALDAGGTIIDAADATLTGLNRIQKAYILAKYATMPVPEVYPEGLKLEVTVRNNTQHDIHDVRIQVKGDNHMSFTGITGPWNASKSLGGGATIPAQQSRTFTVALYPRFSNAKLSPDGNPLEVYTTTLDANCTFIHEDTGSREEQKQHIDLPVSTIITQEWLQKYKQAIWREYNAPNAGKNAITNYALGGAFNGYQRWFGYSTFSQVFTFECPVKVTIASADGAVLGVLEHAGDYFSDGVANGYTDGEAKCVSIPTDSLDLYRITAEATGEGVMDVVTYAIGEPGRFTWKTFETVPLAAGDGFDLQTYADDAADLRRTGGSAQSVSATRREDSDSVRQALEARGLTEQQAESWLQLMTSGVTDAHLASRLGEDADLDGLCALLMNAAEVYYGTPLPAGDDSLSENISRAAAFGLITADEAAALAEQPLTAANAMDLIDRLLTTMGVASASTSWSIAPRTAADENGNLLDTPEAEAALNAIINHPGRDFRLNAGIEDDAPLTMGLAAQLTEGMLNLAASAARRNTFAEALFESLEATLDWYDDYRHILLYAMDIDALPTGIHRDILFWLPAASAGEGLYSNFSSEVLPRLIGYEQSLTDSDASSALRSGGEYGLYVCGEMSGAFACENGDVYRWIPFAYLTANGDIADDTMYLAMLRVSPGTDDDYIERYSVSNATGSSTTAYAIVSDQAMVAALLSAMTEYPYEPVDAAQFSPISRGDKGDAVQALQEALIQHGYMEGTADGSYGNLTAAAIGAVQEAHGLEVTGQADPQTQAALQEERRLFPMFLKWVDAHCGRDVYESGLALVADRLANGTAGELQRLIAGGEGLKQPEPDPEVVAARAAAAARLPEALAVAANLPDDFPQSESALIEQLNLSGYLSLAADLYPGSTLRELYYTAQHSEMDPPFEFISGWLEYEGRDKQTVHLEMTEDVYQFDFEGSVVNYHVYTVQGEVLGEDTEKPAYEMTALYDGRILTFGATDDYSGYTTLTDTLDAEPYTDATLTITQYEYSDFFIVDIRATSPDGSSQLWRATYSDGKLSSVNHQ